MRLKQGVMEMASDPMQALVEVGAFFAFLHVIAKASVSHESHLPVLSPREMLKFRCHSPRLIDRAMFAMGSGEIEFNPELYLSTDHQDHQRFYLAALVASDVLLRNLRKHLGYVQLMINELLHRQKVSKEFHDRLSKLCISASRKYDLKARVTDSLMKW